MNIWIIILIILAVCVAIVIVSSIINNNKIVIKTYNVQSGKIAKPFKAIFLSDLHGNSFGRDNERLIEGIKAIDADIILIGGDMITATVDNMDTKNWNNAFALIEGISDRPIYYAQGNHEYRMDIYRDDFRDGYDRYISKIEGLGVQVLANECSILDEYNAVVNGLSIDRRFYRKFEKHVMTYGDVTDCIGERDKDEFEIVLAHNPEYFDTYAERGDLILSGHLHGGIMKLPVLGGVISPRFRLFPKYDGGEFKIGDSTMIVSRGLGSHTLPFRVFNPCEICVIEIDIKYDMD